VQDSVFPAALYVHVCDVVDETKLAVDVSVADVA